MPALVLVHWMLATCREDRCPWEYCREAIQGHSQTGITQRTMGRRAIQLKDANVPTVLAHGTQARNLTYIVKDGLIPGGPRGTRNENHVTSILDTGILKRAGKPETEGYKLQKEIPGFRTGCDTVIY